MHLHALPKSRTDAKEIEVEVRLMKLRLFTGAVIVMCLSLLGFGTMAYFTAENTAHNVITSGNIKIELQEWADEDKKIPFPKEGIDGMRPGAEATKVVEVKNTGSNAAYVRVWVEKNFTLSEGVTGETDTDLIKIDFNDTSWTLGEDGYYYYNKALEPGDVTEALFTSVGFDPDMGNLYQKSTASVEVTAYAVQVANNGETVMDAKGWPERK